MAKILLIISALVIAATAYLGFATKQKVDALQDNLKDTKGKLAMTQAELSKTKTTLKKTEEDLTAAKATIEEKDKEIAQKKGEIDKLTSELKAKTEELVAANTELAKIKAELNPDNQPKINIEEMVQKVKDLTDAKTRLETELAEAKQVNETLNQQVKAKEEKLTSTQRQVDEYKTGFVRNGLTGTVLAYNSGWNFVVISIGDKQGLKANAPLVVMRGGQMIARVKVTSVEPSTSIADIVPGSLARGQQVQPGDSVVYEGRSK